MKKLTLVLVIATFFLGCDKENFNNRNPYIPNYGFDIAVNTNLPSYSQLQFPGSAIYYPGEGALGIIIFNTGSGYNAFDAACPNQQISSCSTMSINGINAVCACDDAEYSLYTGLAPNQEYPLKAYRVEVNGTVIRVSN